jgi:hypothetical protein
LGREKIMEELVIVSAIVIILTLSFLYKHELNESDRLKKNLAVANNDLGRALAQLNKCSVRDPKTGKFAKRFQT